MGYVIGIDLGTTNSCMCAVEHGEPVVIPNSQGQRTTPSVVAFTKEGEHLIGGAAKRQAVTNPDRTISSIKRQMGTNWSMRLDGHEYKPQTISGMILRQMKEDAEAYLGGSVTDAVITVPAYFNDSQRQATKDAGRIAGLNVLRIINEPTSAALSYGLNHGEAQKVMVYDLGGGTFDVSIIEIGEGVIEVLATAGDNHLGGDDFDRRIADWMAGEIKAQYRTDITKDPTAWNRILEAAESAKKDLSLRDAAQIELPYLTMVKGEPVHLSLTLTGSKFRDLVDDLIDRTEGPVRQALSDAGIAASQLGRVLLVGGSTRMPLVHAKVRSMTGKEPSRNINPDECVAVGAAILGNTLQGNLPVKSDNAQEMVLLDVTPMSLSIETVGGVATRLMDRNTTIPARYAKIFSTAAPFQRDVEINVLQGERPMARDNKSIGKFRLTGIRSAPAGVPQIEVAFDIDANGILKVSARDMDTGRSQSIVITASDRMSESEIEQAIRDAQQYSSQDETRRDALEVIREANTYLTSVQRRLQDEKKTMDRAKRKQLSASCKELQKLLVRVRVDNITEQDVQNIKAAEERVRQAETMI